MQVKLMFFALQHCNTVDCDQILATFGIWAAARLPRLHNKWGFAPRARIILKSRCSDNQLVQASAFQPFFKKHSTLVFHWIIWNK